MDEQRLARAIEVFRDLGWDGAAYEDAPGLPSGSDEQRRIALAGLRSGAWTEFFTTSSGGGMRSILPVDPELLGLFAIRVGVDGRRAVDVLPHRSAFPDAVLAPLLAERGPTFAEAFIRAACVSSRRPWTHEPTWCAGVAVRLVHLLELPVPPSIEYLKDWSALAALELDTASAPRGDREPLGAETLRSRFVEHVRAGIAAGVPATGPFGEVLPAGFARGWIDRDEVVDLGFDAIDAAQRPGDRKVWAALLLEVLELGDDELVARADLWATVLAHGDAAIVEAVLARLVPLVDDDLAVDLVIAGLSTSVRRARLAIVRALAGRRLPQEPAQRLVPALTALAGDRDAAIARAAAALLDGWGAVAPQQGGDPVRGSWSPAPPLWLLPRCEPLPTSSQALVEAAAVLMRKPESAHDVDAERFLDLLVRSAADDLPAALEALRGVRDHWTGGLIGVQAWTQRGGGAAIGARPQPEDPLLARQQEVLDRAGELPVMLSAPTWIDLSIDPADLLERLRAYAEQGVAAGEADLQLALLRLDGSTPTAEQREQLAQLPVPVRGPHGELLPLRAGAIVVGYCDDPYREPALQHDAVGGWWAPGAAEQPRSLAGLPHRLVQRYRPSWYDGTVVPRWSDAATDGFEHWPEQRRGVLLRQAARRAEPFGPAGAVRFLGALRKPHPAAAEEVAIAPLEAFERGLLRPGVADARYLGLNDLAAFAEVALELADEGLAGVVWPVLDGLLTASVSGTRMAAGTAELADAMAALAPTALGAVRDGVADAGMLAVPGLRALAARAGSSRAVLVAREAVATLPEPIAVPPAPVEDEPAFESIWPEGAGEAPAIEDSARILAEWAQTSGTARMLAVDLRLDDHPQAVFRVLKGWVYDLEREGQCQAVRRADADAEDEGEIVYLSWSGERLRVSPRREDGAGQGPLTVAMHAVVLATLCHDGDQGMVGIHLARGLAQRSLIGWRGIGAAMRALLRSPDTSPARMLRVLERHPATLPVLWPVLVESIGFAAGSDAPPPRWLPRVLDVAISVAPLLAEAARRGRIPESSARFPGIEALAARPGRGAAFAKARALRDATLA